MPTPNPVAAVQDAVTELADRLDVLIKECDDPEGASLVDLLGDIRSARERLSALEADVERHAVKAMFDDALSTTRYRAERWRSRGRKEWRREDWQRDVRDKAMRRHGLLNAEFVGEDGTLMDTAAVFSALADVQSVYGSMAPNIRPLRELGLNPDDYCFTSSGRSGVRTYLVGSEGDE